jgi:diguanylate cyclase (GGDEF)-like protein
MYLQSVPESRTLKGEDPWPRVESGRVRKRSLVWKFGVFGAVCFTLLGLMVFRTIGQTIRAHHLSTAQREAEVLTDVGVRPRLGPTDLAGILTHNLRRRLDRALTAEIGSRSGRTVNIYSSEGQLVYTSSEVRAPLGDVAEIPDGLRSALGGHAALEEDGTGGFSTYVPLKFDGSLVAAGAVEVSMPFGPLAEQVEVDSRRLYILVGGGLFGLYIVLLRVVAKSSKRLRKQVEANERQALHDPLTDLPNRILFRDRVQQAIALASRTKATLAVMLIDLDRFKEINDSLGHHHGDLLLQQIGPRLQKLLRETDTIARLGGDEFAILMVNVPDPAAAIHVADKIREELQKPFPVQGITLHIDASIGIALHPGHGKTVDQLLQRSDVAMYMAKASGSGREVYVAQRDENSPSKLALIGELRYAIDGNELLLHYQPKVHLRTGDIQGVEALVRWQHPLRGLMPSGDFVPIAENTGLIEPMTMKILKLALQQARRWQDEGLDLSVAVNLSVRNLLDPKLPQEIAKLLTRYNVEPARLELEITESSIMFDPQRAREILVRLSAMGIRLAIDDFGTGHSSLAYLKELPVHTLKIDKSFIINMTADDNDLVIVQSTIDLAHNLGLEVIAEGVETEEVWNKLKLLGCDLAQGYWRGRPVPAEDLAYAVAVIELPRYPLS